ncbi:MAG: hypothetical protein CMA72_09595 [Euryarchaeota archaeon]|nr:hypothetical protein [Euryarchaeota archaeon]
MFESLKGFNLNLEKIISQFDSFDRAVSTNIWHAVSRQVQEKKLDSNGISDEQTRSQILDQLTVRPALVAYIASEIYKLRGSCRFLEVGTAEGLQSITVAANIPKSEVFTCDVRDVRHETFHNFPNANFTLGNAKSLASNISGKIDVCWIDGAHDHYSVVDDFLSILSLTDENTVWIFDDYDRRFGCWHDISLLLSHFEQTYAVNFGKTASGNPSVAAMGMGFKQ